MSGTLQFLHFTFESGSFNEVKQTAPCLPGNEKSASRGLKPSHLFIRPFLQHSGESGMGCTLALQR